MPIEYGPWIQDDDFEGDFPLRSFGLQTNCRARAELTDPGALDPTEAKLDEVTDDVKASAYNLGTRVGEHYTVFADEATGPTEVNYVAQKGINALFVRADRTWNGPDEPVPPGWTGTEYEPGGIVEVVSVIWDGFVFREYHENITDPDWEYHVWYSNFPEAALPGSVDNPDPFDTAARVSGATSAFMLPPGSGNPSVAELIPNPAGAIDLTSTVSGDDGWFVMYAATILGANPTWDTPFPPGSAGFTFGGIFSTHSPTEEDWIHYTLRPPRYRFWREVDVLPATSPRRKKPRDDGLGVGPARHYPPPTSRQKSIRRGGATYL